MPHLQPDNDVDALKRRIAQLEEHLDRERSARRQAADPGAEIRLLERMPYAVLVTRNGIILFANQEAARLHGADSGDMLKGRFSFSSATRPSAPMTGRRWRKASGATAT